RKIIICSLIATSVLSMALTNVKGADVSPMEEAFSTLAQQYGDLTIGSCADATTGRLESNNIAFDIKKLLFNNVVIENTANTSSEYNVTGSGSSTLDQTYIRWNVDSNLKVGAGLFKMDASFSRAYSKNFTQVKQKMHVNGTYEVQGGKFEWAKNVDPQLVYQSGFPLFQRSLEEVDTAIAKNDQNAYLRAVLAFKRKWGTGVVTGITLKSMSFIDYSYAWESKSNEETTQYQASLSLRKGFASFGAGVSTAFSHLSQFKNQSTGGTFGVRSKTWPAGNPYGKIFESLAVTFTNQGIAKMQENAKQEPAVGDVAGLKAPSIDPKDISIEDKNKYLKAFVPQTWKDALDQQAYIDPKGLKKDEKDGDAPLGGAQGEQNQNVKDLVDLEI
ncbi:MAG: hypothetical protein WCR55_14525, partial [Lentisphaerota bacterium]